MSNAEGDWAHEVVELTQQLIRIDTSNYGDDPLTQGEREAAEFCADKFREVGLEPEVFATTSERRAGVAVRISGTRAHADALVLHGHLDVVPAIEAEWSHPPFAGELDDGFVWGRGAVDMKNTDAMIMTVIRHWARTGIAPTRDVIVVFFPDEEAGMRHGSQWVVKNRPELFEGATHAVGEVGGFSVSVRDDLRLYPIQTAEKGIRWMRMRTQGRAGHGSMIHPDNAVSEVARLAADIADHVWPTRISPTVQVFLDELRAAFDLPHAEPEQLLQRIGTLGLLVGATMQNTANPTMLTAGYKVNVIPSEAMLGVDGRVLPGFESEFEATIDAIVHGRADIEFVNSDIAVEAPWDSAFVHAMGAALRSHDQGAHPVPYMISGGTDAKALSTLGIECYGFSPLRMPAGLDYWRLFHGVDERVPVDGLIFGTHVLDEFLRSVN